MKKLQHLTVFLAITALFCAGFATSAAFADDSKTTVLKKINGSYRLKRVGVMGVVSLTDRVITFKPGSNLTITEKVEGFAEEFKTEISLDRITLEGEGIVFGYKFQGDVSSSTIRITRGGKINGESSRFGRVAEINFSPL